ncbi:MAG: carbonate dehydratase [Planctomycetaceae bacterium]|jgi:carbonic anhydrase|nr:carbonate dehydratase [Planctomycetaceae bacterium]
MSELIRELFERNRRWIEDTNAKDEDFFRNLSKGQSPDILWIGCSDSRVPPNQIIGSSPGELFEHRNIANVVVHSDFNCLSVIEYAVAMLKVKHIIVCGHHGCGGVIAATENHHLGLIDNWLRHIRDVRSKYSAELIEIEDPNQQLDRLCELNVIEQVQNVCRTTIVQEAWEQGCPLSVHGWIYAIKAGSIHDLEVTMNSQDDIERAYHIETRPDN